MKIYIAGKITGCPDYKERFARAEARLRAEGHTVMNPAILPPGFEWHEYMSICVIMVQVCAGIYMLNNWQDSDGAKVEHKTAVITDKVIMYEGSDE